MRQMWRWLRTEQQFEIGQSLQLFGLSDCGRVKWGLCSVSGGCMTLPFHMCLMSPEKFCVYHAR